MPGGDGTGPAGLGPKTGRAAGYCAGYPAPGCAHPGPGRGFGRGLNRRRAMWGAPYYNWGPYQPAPALPTKQQELDMLKSQARSIQQAADEVEQRISELSSQADAGE